MPFAFRHIRHPGVFTQRGSTLAVCRGSLMRWSNSAERPNAHLRKADARALPPGGIGKRILTCVDCDPLRDEKMKGWPAGDLGRDPPGALS